MKVVVFDQWDKLLAKFRTIAAGSATEKLQYAITRLEPKSGRVTPSDHAMNNLTLDGETVEVVMPDIVPGKAREFVLRVTATGDSTLSFTGAESFEGEADALRSPEDGETIVYFFTETEADVFLVARRKVGKLETE